MNIDRLANLMVLGALLDEVVREVGSYELVAHWTQGEFHHDVVLRLPKHGLDQETLPGSVLVVATNCNGGIKEVLAFDDVPDRSALWHHRCPDVKEFSGTLDPILARATTSHWFDPCELLVANARSELREEFRERQEGGGWRMSESGGGAKK
ncbi:MAG: hypothetical protein ACRELY_19775 [Polyangiaceae bacterium]